MVTNNPMSYESVAGEVYKLHLLIDGKPSLHCGLTMGEEQEL
jgi:hypothetical protein